MKKLIIFIYILCLPLLSVSVNAQDAINLGNKQPAGVKAINNPDASVSSILANALQIMFIFGGLAVLVFVVWGAFDWITAGGDKEKIAGARKKIINALIGLGLLSLAVFIVTLFGQILGFDPLKTPALPSLGDAPKAFPPAVPATR